MTLYAAGGTRLWSGWLGGSLWLNSLLMGVMGLRVLRTAYAAPGLLLPPLAAAVLLIHADAARFLTRDW